MGVERGQRLGWYLGFGGGSVWMIVPVVGCFVEGHWWLGSAALAAAIAVIAFIVYLPPWKNPDVPFWKLILPYWAVQVVMVSTMLAVFEPHNPSMAFVPCQLAFFAILPIATGKRRWNDGLDKPKPVTAADGLE